MRVGLDFESYRKLLSLYNIEIDSVDVSLLPKLVPNKA